MIEYQGTDIVYENPVPHVRSRHGYFPGMVKLPSGELLTLFVRGEAFEAADSTTFITRSVDDGATWSLEGSLYHKERLPYGTSEAFKPALLADGSLIAIGYRFRRDDPEKAIAIPETGGFPPGENVVSFSDDEGRHWSEPVVMPRSTPELIEISGPAMQTRSGDLLAVGALFHLPDGTNPSGPVGVLLRSRDGGHTWNDRERYYRWNGVVPFESRICEMESGRLAVILWAYDSHTKRHYPNQVTVSHDNGETWSEPIDTGHMGQSSNLLWLGGDLLLSCHAHRGDDPGLYVRLVDFHGDRWRVLEERLVWGRSIGVQTRDGQGTAQMFASMRFGQPSLLRLDGNRYLLVHWSIEEGQGKIRLHRLTVTP